MAAHHSHLGLALFDGTAENLGDFLSHGVTAGGTAQTLQVALGHTGLGKSTAAGFAATATVGAGQYLSHLVNHRVFDHLEFLGYKIEHHGKEGADNA